MPGWLVDTNVWLAAIFTTHPLHQVARDALQQATSAEPAVFCRATQLSFLRLSSTPTLLKAYGAEGLTNRDALVALNALLALRQVSVREEPRGTLALWHGLSALNSASPKVCMDAYLAAFAISGGLRMLTLDQDFRNFVPRGLDLALLQQR